MKPRALVVANRLPFPIDDGWKRRTFHLLKGLATRYRVTLVSLHAGAVGAADVLRAELGGDIEVHTVRPFRFSGPLSIALGLLTRRPFHVWRLQSRAMRRLLSELCRGEEFEVAVATLIHLHPYLRSLSRATLRVVDTHNIDSLVLRRYARRMRGPSAWYAALSADKLQRHEADVFADADLIWVCSREERELIARSSPGAHVAVVPNGVDTEAFSPVTDQPIAANSLVFFGRLDYFPNADAVGFFAREIFPLVRREIPDAEFLVVGPGAGAELAATARSVTGMRVMGAVADLRSVIGTAAVVVVPLKSGGGTRLKILEALALGRPVVSTTVGAEGLEIEPGREIMLADEPQAFAHRVIQLLRSPDTAAQLGRAGRERVRERYDWRYIERELLATLASASPEEPFTGNAA